MMLVLGSIEQPPVDVVKQGADQIKAWYAQQVPEGASAAPPVELIVGAKAANDRLAAILHQHGKGASIALRDFYPGWEAAGCRCGPQAAAHHPPWAASALVVGQNEPVVRQPLAPGVHTRCVTHLGIFSRSQSRGWQAVASRGGQQRRHTSTLL